MDSPVIAEKRGSLGLLTLNRPQALNALTHDMIRALAAALGNWARDDAIQTVAIRGEGRAFCAGGDVRAVRQAILDGTQEGAKLLCDEYRLNALIGSYPKPYVALLHGITMGGGAGISVHGAYRLADSALVFAMPEAAIGFIPDVGASHFLSRLPGEFGMYLALTGARIGVGDADGLITHVVAQTDFARVIEGLARGDAPEAVIAPLARKPEPGVLAPHRRRIQTIFSAASVEAILERLDRDGSEFSRDTAQTIRAMSPTSVRLTFRLLREAVKLDLKRCLALEYRLAQRVIVSPDFREGVRAALVDKDRAPQWKPASLAAVGNIDGVFVPSQDELF
jgi:enoyl-CoA hydratase